MHDAWHELLHLAAAAVLCGGGGLFLALAFADRRRRLRGAAPPPVEPAMPADPARGAVILAASLSLGAAAVHLAVAPAHIADFGPAGWGFVGAAAFQAAWALAAGIGWTRTVAGIGIAGNLAIVAAWLWSRTVGLPIGAAAAGAEPVGVADAAATAFELLLVALLAGRLAGLGRRLPRRAHPLRASGAVVLVPAIGVVFLAATVAVGAALGHGHGPEGHLSHGAMGAPAAPDRAPG